MIISDLCICMKYKVLNIVPQILKILINAMDASLTIDIVKL